jgi:hypothetical protein
MARPEEEEDEEDSVVILHVIWKGNRKYYIVCTLKFLGSCPLVHTINVCWRRIIKLENVS